MANKIPTLGLLVWDEKEGRWNRERGTGSTRGLNRSGLLLIGKTIPRPKNPVSMWQTSQGGLHFGEDVNDGRLRENQEEFGITPDNVIHIADIAQHGYYGIQFPKPGDKYDGMRVAVRLDLLKDDTVIDLNSWFNDQPPEFSEYKYVYPSELLNMCSPHKREFYAAAMHETCMVADVLAEIHRLDPKLPEEDVVKEVQGDSRVLTAFQTGALAMTVPSFEGIAMRSTDPVFIAAQQNAALAHAAYGS